MSPLDDKAFQRRFKPFVDRMQQVRLPDLVIKRFGLHYRQLLQGHSGMLGREEIAPVEQVPDAEGLTGYQEPGRAAISKTIVLKLNGGLGTSMGLDQAKSLLVAKEGLNFLDITARQVLATREAYHCNLPLVLMNSFNTRQDSLDHLAAYPDLQSDVPLDFVQHRVPKVAQDGLTPVSWEPDPTLEWCPPGHGDIYTALLTSGMLKQLLSNGYVYAFVSNVDNLGAVLDEQILGYFAHHGFPFMMEVADRTPADRKGGHLARLKDGRLALRESAQCPPEEETEFQDIHLYQYFNTNNLWINLVALQDVLDKQAGLLGLPLIINRKTVDPKDKNTPRVFQLETAMGAAISSFQDAQALRVPRTRFAPVKTCDDLLGLRSDVYILTPDGHVRRNPARRLNTLVVELDPRYYRLIDDFEARFPHGAPSLIRCEQLTIKGDVCFGRNVAISGQVAITNQTGEQIKVPDSTDISQDLEYL